MLASLIAGERLPQVHGARPASARRRRRVRADRRGAAARAAARRAVRRSLRLLLAAARLPGVRACSGSRTAPTRSIPATVVGKPRQEDFFIGDLLQELLSPLFPLVMPAVEQLWSYGETGYHSLAAAVVKQRYKREAMASAFRILGEGQLSLTKFLLVTDRHVDVRDFRATLEHVLARTQPGDRPLRLLEPVDGHARLHRAGGERGIEGRVAGPRRPGARAAAAVHAATLPCGRHRRARLLRRLPGRRRRRPTPPSPAPPRGSPRDPAFADWPLVVLTDEPARAARSDMNFLWTTFTRFEPAADIHAAERRIVRNHIAYRGPIVIDARLKPWYPAGADLPRATRARWSRRAGASTSRPATSRWATRSAATWIDVRNSAVRGRIERRPWTIPAPSRWRSACERVPRSLRRGCRRR